MYVSDKANAMSSMSCELIRVSTIQMWREDEETHILVVRGLLQRVVHLIL